MLCDLMTPKSEYFPQNDKIYIKMLKKKHFVSKKTPFYVWNHTSHTKTLFSDL